MPGGLLSRHRRWRRRADELPDRLILLLYSKQFAPECLGLLVYRRNDASLLLRLSAQVRNLGSGSKDADADERRGAHREDEQHEETGDDVSTANPEAEYRVAPMRHDLDVEAIVQKFSDSR